jgi:hypothetical protein
MSDELNSNFQDASLELLRIIADNQQALATELADIKEGIKFNVEQTMHAKVLAGHALQQIADVANFVLPVPEVDPDEEVVDAKIQELLASGLPNDPAIIEATRNQLLAERKQAVVDASWEPDYYDQQEDDKQRAALRLQELFDETQSS